MCVQNCTHIGRVELKKSIIIDIDYGTPLLEVQIYSL
jgi:hypothetical protein